jgi:hypothetical protein
VPHEDMRRLARAQVPVDDLAIACDVRFLK